jgi:hypothetical protein
MWGSEQREGILVVRGLHRCPKIPALVHKKDHKVVIKERSYSRSGFTRLQVENSLKCIKKVTYRKIIGKHWNFI